MIISINYQIFPQLNILIIEQKFYSIIKNTYFYFFLSSQFIVVTYNKYILIFHLSSFNL